MVDINSSIPGNYRAVDQYFHGLYVDASCRSPHERTSVESLWETIDQYVPLFSGSYAIPGSAPEPDPLEQLVSHRSAVLKAQVEGLMQQLYERRKIHDHAIKSIDYDTVKVDGELLQLEQMMRTCRINPPPELSKKEQNLESELMNLERQRRDEYSSFWKDQVLLRKDMIELAGAHMAAKARESIFDGVSGYGN